MRGRPDESIQHLRSGARLITSRPPHLVAETGQTDAGAESSVEEIARLFARIGVQASLYKEDEVVPDLRAYIRPTEREPHDSAQPFGDFVVARDSLYDLDIDLATYHNRAFVLAQAYKKNLQQSASEPPIYVDGLDPTAAVPDIYATYGPSYVDGLDIGPVMSKFRIWRRRFDKTVQQAEKRGPTKRERHEIAMLELRRRVWETNLDEIPSGSPEQAGRILDQAEFVLRLFSSKHPIFTLESHISPSVSFICFYSNEERHRRRALDILRSARMREAVWDSTNLVRIIEPQFGDTGRGAL
ncbi:hypothetical protein CGLO_00185 [Colletotrichum gloeosporioides Cg-14]|uniref:Uncharacterized protein n=1 Tax=Colletotrichum gloeosporioides (strain Cg-14) TaxID=1237896 RepID=T0L3T8_COLGC|nr:hypothetical protein CGLO_00185 [Colletotrichum gloeosporioides Cg-14]